MAYLQAPYQVTFLSIQPFGHWPRLYDWSVSSEHLGFLFLVFFISLFLLWFRAADYVSYMLAFGRTLIYVVEIEIGHNRARQLYKNISMLFLFPVKRDLLFTNI